MSYCAKFEFEQDVKAGKVADLYFLFGGEFFALQASVDLIVNAVVDENFKSLNFSEFDGDAENFELIFEDLQNCLNTVAFLTGRRVALIKNLSYFKLSKSTLKKFESLIFESTKNSICIVTILTENFDYGQMKKFKAWLETLPKTAKIVDCSVNSNRELFNFFSHKVKNWGSDIGFANFNFLVSRLQKDWHAVYSELEKLSSFAAGREILKEDVLNLTELNLNFNAFELAESILNLNMQKALEILKGLIETGTNVFLIFGAINSSFVDIYRVKVCSDFSDAQIAKIFDYKNYRFRLSKARKMSFKFSLEKVRKCILILSKLDLNLKTMSIDNNMLMEKTIVEMIMHERI